MRAFEVAAVDYLLKPVRRERLEAALERARTLLGSRDAGRARDTGRIRDLLERLARRAAAEEPAPVTARAGSTVRVFDPRAITRFSASEKYAIFRKDGAEFVLDESLVSLERRLGDAGFLRVHRGELVNLKRVKAVGVEDGATYVELADGERVPVSRRFVGALKERLGLRGG